MATECIQWSDNLWLHAFGLNHLNVLEYFYNSPFYDPNSNNQNIRTQAIGVEFLKSMTGIQYILDEGISQDPSIFVIKKVKRSNPHTTFLLALYYCADGIVYESPNLLELFRARTAKTSNYLCRAFDQLRGSVSTDQIKTSVIEDVIDTNTVVSADPSTGSIVRHSRLQKLPAFDRVLSDLDSF